MLLTENETVAETRRLDEVATRYDPSNPAEEFDFYTKRLHVLAIANWLRGDRVLEMGCATGELTSLMAPHAATYEVVEGSGHNACVTRERCPEVAVHESLWEDFDPVRPYSDILLVCALEHVIDPVDILTRARRWLEPGGRLHVIVPNSESFHRFVGVELGVLPDRKTLSDSDHRIGHRRVYDIDELRTDMTRAGLRTVHWEGIFLKMLANRQMLGWDWELIAAMDRVGKRFPMHCAEIYLVAEPS
jgi:trans-aconitate methyltransferase